MVGISLVHAIKRNFGDYLKADIFGELFFNITFEVILKYKYN